MRLDWKDIAAYKVTRSENGINFNDVVTVVESEAALFNQPTRKKLIYQAIAINKAGEGMPSNTVSLVL